MKRFLRSILSFLDRKFPDKVVVNLAAYQSLEKAIVDLTIKAEMQDVKTRALETNLANLNLAVGFSAPKMGVLER